MGGNLCDKNYVPETSTKLQKNYKNQKTRIKIASKAKNKNCIHKFIFYITGTRTSTFIFYIIGTFDEIFL